MRLILALLLITPPLWANPACAEGALDPAAAAAPGAVALYVQAHALYALGQAAQDPLTVVAAARLLRRLTLTDIARSPTPALPATLTPLDPSAMLDAARALDAGQNFTDLIDLVATEAQSKPQALRATAANLPAGASQTWTLAFFGGTYAELAILGAGKGNLDLSVTDAVGGHICLDKGSADTALCGFTLRDNGTVTVTVTNSGPTPDSYTLVTN